MKRRHIITFITALGLAVVLTVALLTGSALAAPEPLDVHQPLALSGTVAFEDWVFGDPTKEYVEDGKYYSPGHVLTWTLHGDLEGTYVMEVTYIWPLLGDPGPYQFEGRATFEGTILGVRTTWAANVDGSGLMDYSDPAHTFKGEDSWTSTLTSSATPLSHMRGSIVIAGTFDYGWSPDTYTYAGSLVWETGEKK